MYTPAITGSGIFTPEQVITNAELVKAFNAYADLYNAEHAAEIDAGELPAKEHSSEEFIVKASGIEQRYVMDKTGILDPKVMHPLLRQRSDDEPGLMAEMALDAAQKALQAAGKTAADVDAVICAASNLERAYPAVAIEIQEWRDRDCHFIFGDVATAVLIERAEDAAGAYFEIKSTRCATEFSNNIRNNNGFLRRSRPDGVADRRDMQFMQNGRKVFKEVLPMVAEHIAGHMADEGVEAADLKRLWLHQANKSMNDFIGRKVLGRAPDAGEQPNILQDYANTSSAGSIIAFSKYSDDLTDGDTGLICSFGAGYSVGSVLVQRHG